MRFTKANGTLNHFLIVYSNNKEIHLQNYIVRFVKNSRYNRVDGVLVLSDSNQADFKMDYYNNDGTWETMCANGARCAALYMSPILKKKSMCFEAGDGMHEAEIINSNNVKLKMSSPQYCSDKIKACGVQGFHVDSGAPHFVVEYPEISNQTAKDLGAKIRHHQAFSPRGINVNFYEVISRNEITVRTYEKGIEDLMMSCGSGSVACAYHLFQMKQIKSPIKINVLGGELFIDFDSKWSDVWLSGHTEIEHSIKI